jgi:hypothetical protein
LIRLVRSCAFQLFRPARRLTTRWSKRESQSATSSLPKARRSTQPLERNLLDVMRRISAPWLCFALVELYAVAGWFLWPLFTSSQFGPFLWGSQLILLMPGSIVAGELVEGLAWGRISLLTMGILIPLWSVGLNALLFWIALRILARFRLRWRSNTSLESTRGE